MSLVKVSGNASGTGTLTIAAPNTNTDYTLTLPTATTTLVGTDATQTLTNKTIQGGAITSGTAVASTSGTSIDFNSIPSWVKRITVMFNEVSTSGTSALLIQVGNGSVVTTGYVSTSNSTNQSNFTAGVSSTAGFCVNSNDATFVRSGSVTLFLVDTSNTWVSSHTVKLNTTQVAFGGGSKALGGALDRVRITTVNGTDTFDAGSINIMYEG